MVFNVTTVLRIWCFLKVLCLLYIYTRYYVCIEVCDSTFIGILSLRISAYLVKVLQGAETFKKFVVLSPEFWNVKV